MSFKNKILKKNINVRGDLYSVGGIIESGNKHKDIEGKREFDFIAWLHNDKTKKIIKVVEGLGQIPYTDTDFGKWLNIRLLANLIISIDPQIPPGYISWMLRQIRVNDKKELHDMTNEIAKFYDVPFSSHIDFIERVKLAMAFRYGADSWNDMNDTQMVKSLTLCRKIDVNIRAIMDVDIAVKLVIGDIYKTVSYKQENKSGSAW